eukprot:128846-Amphidinium_carterae.1
MPRRLLLPWCQNLVELGTVLGNSGGCHACMVVAPSPSEVGEHGASDTGLRWVSGVFETEGMWYQYMTAYDWSIAHLLGGSNDVFSGAWDLLQVYAIVLMCILEDFSEGQLQHCGLLGTVSEWTPDKCSPASPFVHSDVEQTYL